MTSIFDVPGTNAPNPFITPIETLLTSNPPGSMAGDEIVANIVKTITTSPNPPTAIWQLWDHFFTTVATSPTHTQHLAVLDAIQAQAPTEPSNVRPGSEAAGYLSSYVKADGKLHWPLLPGFGAQWRDVHDILEARRDWDTSVPGLKAAGFTGSCAEYFLRFCIFSAALLKHTAAKGPEGRGNLADQSVWVFYACKLVLEKEDFNPPHAEEANAHRISPEKTWALDVRIAATWVRDGGHALWQTDQEYLRLHWADTLDEKTELWPRDDGLTQDRWQLWGNRLQALSSNDQLLHEETRMVVKDAAEVIEEILQQ